MAFTENSEHPTEGINTSAMILINEGRQCEWRLEPAMLTWPKVTGQIEFISCIYNPTPLYGRESRRPNQRWKTLLLNPVRRTSFGRSFLVKDAS